MKKSFLLSTLTVMGGVILLTPLATRADTNTTITSTNFQGGNLTLDVAPNFDFGTHALSNSTLTLKASAGTDGTENITTGNQVGLTAAIGTTIPNIVLPTYDDTGVKVADTTEQNPFVAITDLTGSGAGWTVAVQQATDFTDAASETLKGAQITYSTTDFINLSGGTVGATPVTKTLTPDNKPYLVASSTGGAGGIGADTNVISFGGATPPTADGTDTNPARLTTSSVQLSVPAGSFISTTTPYTTTLTWTLQSGPAAGAILNNDGTTTIL